MFDYNQWVILPWYPRVMPGADTCLCVKEVHLALHSCSLLCYNKETMLFVVVSNLDGW